MLPRSSCRPGLLVGERLGCACGGVLWGSGCFCQLCIATSGFPEDQPVLSLGALALFHLCGRKGRRFSGSSAPNNTKTLPAPKHVHAWKAAVQVTHAHMLHCMRELQTCMHMTKMPLHLLHTPARRHQCTVGALISCDKFTRHRHELVFDKNDSCTG